MSSSKKPQMARPKRYLAGKRKNNAKSPLEKLAKGLSTFLTGPTGQQLLSLALILFGLLTIATLAGLNSGSWIDSWARMLVWLCGWGAYPTAMLITALGLLWLRHLVHKECIWRWRPIFGLELALTGLLGLTHTLFRQEGWGLVEAGLGGGVIGWALSIYFTLYFGPLITGVGMVLLTLLGLGLAFDLTCKDLLEFGQRLKSAWQTSREITQAAKEKWAEKERSAAAQQISQGVATSPLPERSAPALPDRRENSPG